MARLFFSSAPRGMVATSATQPSQFRPVTPDIARTLIISGVCGLAKPNWSRLGSKRARRRPLHATPVSAGSAARASSKDANEGPQGSRWDNALMQGFFGVLKTELVHHREYPNH